MKHQRGASSPGTRLSGPPEPSDFAEADLFIKDVGKRVVGGADPEGPPSSPTASVRLPGWFLGSIYFPTPGNVCVPLGLFTPPPTPRSPPRLLL